MSWDCGRPAVSRLANEAMDLSLDPPIRSLGGRWVKWSVEQLSVCRLVGSDSGVGGV